MHQYRFTRAFWGDIVACGLATALIALFAFAVFGLEFGSAEEGPLETVQEWFLALAFGFLLASAWLQPPGAPRLASLSGAALSMVFFFRELEPVGDGPVATYLQSGTFRLHQTIVLAVLAALAAPRNARFLPEILRWLVSRASWPFFVAGALLLFADIIDGHHVLWGIEWLPRAIEESIETFVYAILLACSVRWFATAKAGAGTD